MTKSTSFTGQTLIQVLKQVQETLKGRKVYNGWPMDERDIQTRFEAETMLRYITGLSRTAFLTSLSQPLSDEQATWLAHAVENRLQSMPLGYIVKTVNFYGFDFQVGPGCLIPRPETEILVDEAARWILQHIPNGHIYDLGCGSGIISIALALTCKESKVEAVDISADALQIAKLNAAHLGANVSFSHLDGLSDLKTRAVGKLNVLVSNPPYIPTADIQTLEPDVKDYEPHLALDGGVDGLFFYRSIFAMGDTMFESDSPAALFFEVGIGQADLLLHELQDGLYPGFSNWSFGVHNDNRSVPRVLYGERIS